MKNQTDKWRITECTTLKDMIDDIEEHEDVD